MHDVDWIIFKVLLPISNVYKNTTMQTETLIVITNVLNIELVFN